MGEKTPAELIKEVRDLICTTQIAEIGGHAFELAKTKLAARAGPLADALEESERKRAAPLSWATAIKIALALAPAGDIDEQARAVLRIAAEGAAKP